MEPTDETLLEQCAGGDRRASALLIQRHSTRVLNVAQRMVGSRQDAEDITQEVFIKVFKVAGSWESGRAKFTTWLHRVTVNQCLDRLRKSRETLMDEPPEQIDDGLGPAGQLLSNQRAMKVKAAIDALPERQRAALVLSHYEGVSNIETAEILDVTVEAVESLLGRARRALKAALIQERETLTGTME